MIIFELKNFKEEKEEKEERKKKKVLFIPIKLQINYTNPISRFIYPF